MYKYTIKNKMSDTDIYGIVPVISVNLLPTHVRYFMNKKLERVKIKNKI